MKLLVVPMAALIAVLLQQADAVARLCINGDDEITDLYVDGVSFIDKLPYADSVKKCDCVELPPNAGVIAVEAKNVKQTRGIQACNTAPAAVYRDWVCRPARQQQGDNWYQASFYDDNWKPAKQYDCLEHCRQYYKQPCSIASTKCFWAHKVLPHLPSVRCRLKQCADGCTGCQIAGPGSCDPDKCKLGNGTSALTQKTTCNRVCLLEVKAWGPDAGEVADGYIRVIDNETKSVDEWKANVTGDYLVTIDMSTCSITNRNYVLWPQSSQNTGVYNTWNAVISGANFINVLGVELGVGPDPTPRTSFAPWISFFKLGLGDNIPAYANDHYHGLSATLTGVQNGVIAVTNLILTT